MNDDFEESLRETLGKAIPKPPEEAGRAAGARAYTHRVRRTRAVLAVGAVAAVVGAIVVIPSVLASSDHTAGPGPKTSQTLPTLAMPPLAYPYACPTNGDTIQYWSTPKRGVVPTGAVLARICPEGSENWSPPTEPLVTDVESLVSEVNAGQDVTNAKGVCFGVRSGLRYRLTFQYGDGHTVAVEGWTGGCSEVVAGPVSRLGGAAVLRGYLNRLHDQRTSFASGPSTMPEPTCPPAPTASAVLVDGRPPGLVNAAVCSYVTMGSQPTAVTLTAPQVSEVNADLAANAAPQPMDTSAVRQCASQRRGPIRGSIVIAGINPFGDRVELSADDCEQGYSFLDREGTWYWTPSRNTQLMLNAVTSTRGGIRGRLLGVGGPPPGVHLGWPGTLYLTRPGSKFVLTAGSHGFFNGHLDPGRYRFVGYSPSYNDGKTACNPTHPFVDVLPHQTVVINVYCQLK